MATISGVKEQIINANALGRSNLADKGVELPENATTYDIMQSIAEITSGDGVSYTNIVYNSDNTITLLDTDGNEHTIVCEYDEDKLIGATYDGAEIDLTYENEILVGVGRTSIDLNNVKISGGGSGGSAGDTISYADMVYEHFGVDKAEYPCLFFYHWDNNNRGDMGVYFAKTFELDDTGVIKFQEHLQATQSSIYPPVIENTMSVVGGVIGLMKPTLLKTVASGSVQSYDRDAITFTNVVVGETDRYRNLVVI